MVALGYTLIVFRLVAGTVQPEIGGTDMLWSTCQAADRQLMASTNIGGVPHAWGRCVQPGDVPAGIRKAR